VRLAFCLFQQLLSNYLTFKFCNCRYSRTRHACIFFDHGQLQMEQSLTKVPVPARFTHSRTIAMHAIQHKASNNACTTKIEYIIQVVIDSFFLCLCCFPAVCISPRSSERREEEREDSMSNASTGTKGDTKQHKGNNTRIHNTALM